MLVALIAASFMQAPFHPSFHPVHHPRPAVRPAPRPASRPAPHVEPRRPPATHARPIERRYVYQYPWWIFWSRHPQDGKPCDGHCIHDEPNKLA